jgi:hypothetical protein
MYIYLTTSYLPYQEQTHVFDQIFREQYSIPKIKRLIANINVKRNAPSNGDANTINDMAIDNIPTPIANDLDHCDAFRRDAVIP